jgi:type II secretory pathway component PulF
MAFIVTPRQLSVRAEFYHQFGAMLTAGVPIVEVFKAIHRNPPSRGLRRLLEQWRHAVENGCTFSDAMRSSGEWMPSFDIALLESGERSGRLDATLHLLGNYYEERAALVRQTISDLLYPLFIFHFAILLAPFPKLFLTGDVTAYLLTVAVPLAPLYGGGFFLVWACQGRRGDLWRTLLEAVCRFIPLLGSARRGLALARLTAAMEALLNAGVSIIKAWELAATASGSPAIKREVLSWHDALESGHATPGGLLSKSSLFPELFTNLYHTGEVSGKLDDALSRLNRYYQDEASRKLKLLARWFPIIIYVIIMGFVAVSIVNQYMGVMQPLNDVLNGR